MDMSRVVTGGLFWVTEGISTDHGEAEHTRHHAFRGF